MKHFYSASAFIGFGLLFYRIIADGIAAISTLSALLFCLSASMLGLGGNLTSWFEVSRPNLLGVFALSYFSLLIIPACLNPLWEGGQTSSSIVKFEFALHISFFLVIVSAGLCRQALTSLNAEKVSLSTSVSIGADVSLAWILLGLIFGVGSLTWFVLDLRSQVPLLVYLHGNDPLAVLQARQASLAGKSGTLFAYLFEFSRNFVFPVLAAATLIIARSRRNFVALALSTFAISVALLASLLTLEKSPLIRLIVVCFLALHWSANFSRKHLVFGAAATALIYLALVRVSIGAGGTDHELQRLFQAAWDRLAIGPVATASNYFSWTSEGGVPALLGRTLSTFNRFMTESAVDSSSLVYDFADPAALVHGSANGSFFSQLWVDFRWPGVLLGGIFTGVLIEAIQTTIDRCCEPQIKLPLAGLFGFQVIILTMTALSESVANFGFGALDILVLLVIVDRRAQLLQATKPT